MEHTYGVMTHTRVMSTYNGTNRVTMEYTCGVMSTHTRVMFTQKR